MGTRDPRVDAYIDKAPDFATPILRYLRDTVHEAVPEVDEGIKWGVPHFGYKGMFCGIAAFKQYCALVFWKGSLVVDDRERNADGMGQFGTIKSMADLPPKKALVAYLKKAKQLNDDGVKVERKTTPKKPLRVPADLAGSLKKNRKAQAAFDAFSPSKKRDYVEWLTDAKTDATRQKRLETAIGWIAQGKSRNWKYER